MSSSVNDNQGVLRFISLAFSHACFLPNLTHANTVVRDLLCKSCPHAAFSVDGSGMESGVPPTSPSASSGNGVIAQPKKIRGVGFGDIFREGSVKLRARVPSPDKEEKKDKVSGSLPLTVFLPVSEILFHSLNQRCIIRAIWICCKCTQHPKFP